MRNTIFFCLVFFAHITHVTAQNKDFDNYSSLVSEGNLPLSLTISSTEKFEKQKESIDKNEKTETKNLKEQFYLESTFSLDELLRSGKVLFNDPVGKYVNLVYSKVKHAANISDRVSYAYILKTNYSNAFATDKGLIFITTGLLARFATLPANQ